MVSRVPAESIPGYTYFGRCSVAQSCLTICDPMGRSPAGSSVHEILQARILEILLQRIFLTQGANPPGVSCISGRFFTH